MVRYLEKAVKDYGLSGEFLLGYEADLQAMDFAGD